MAEGYEKIELKMPVLLLFLIGIGAVGATAVLGYFAFQPTTSPSVRMLLLLGLVAYLLIDAAMVYYFYNTRVVASESGIAYQRPFNSRSVPWDAIASYSHTFQETKNDGLLQLRNREGVVILAVPVFMGTVGERKRLREVLDWHCKRMAKR